jgi:hypothetical protein
MVYGTVPADNVMRADLGPDKGKSPQGLGTTVLRGMVDNDKIRFAQVEIGGAHPIRGGLNGIGPGGKGGFADDAGKASGGILICLICCLVGVNRASCEEEKKGDREYTTKLHNMKIILAPHMRVPKIIHFCFMSRKN